MARAHSMTGGQPLEGSAELIAGGLRDLAGAGADEAILVASPITERSIRLLADVLEELNGRG
jgi:alkanesulfonate monooxygenase SsuD/methylene tetrahydromethanopterin reductase-like flavin-dependent oxidoreductase (luciferase family)